MPHRLLSLLALLCLALVARAHPVAQGSMEVRIQADHVDVTVRASNEQAFVQAAFDTAAEPGLEALWTRHSEYLQEHIHVAADGVALAGEVVRIHPSDTPAATSLGEYFLRYHLPAGAAKPRVVELRQDVLNDLEFTPGNRWEATYVASVAQAGQPGRAALLFDCKTVLRQECDWAAPASAAPAELDRGRVFYDYLRHGVFHILTGYDHMLFMAALVLAVTSLLDLVKVVTAFTIAHTITLTLAVLRLVHLPAHIVEPMIAASIVVVALQNIFWPRQTHGWSRLAIAFGFGLFHGLGFAGGLLDAMSELPAVAIALAITAFSIGVELGHQAVVIPIYGGLTLARRFRQESAETGLVHRFAMRYGSAAVCVAGCVYLVAALGQR
jgi:hydrogenase/urease accessory protein HupE